MISLPFGSSGWVQCHGNRKTRSCRNKYHSDGYEIVILNSFNRTSLKNRETPWFSGKFVGQNTLKKRWALSKPRCTDSVFYSSLLVPPLSPCKDTPLGMEGRLILDNQITPIGAGHSVRLGSDLGWCFGENDPYLEVDLRSQHEICALATQGHAFDIGCFVTQYEIHYSQGFYLWEPYKDHDKKTKVYHYIRVWYGMVWYGMVWCGTVLYNV